jgi:probable rRNA maturation factor
VRRANREFRGKAGSTDVLSFVDDEPGRLGDILISAGRAKRQSDEFGHATTDEIKTLILHGFLHLLGYDHETDQGRMRRRENQLQRKYGLATTLTGRAAS